MHNSYMIGLMRTIEQLKHDSPFGGIWMTHDIYIV